MIEKVEFRFFTSESSQKYNVAPLPEQILNKRDQIVPIITLRNGMTEKIHKN